MERQPEGVTALQRVQRRHRRADDLGADAVARQDQDVHYRPPIWRCRQRIAAPAESPAIRPNTEPDISPVPPG